MFLEIPDQFKLPKNALLNPSEALLEYAAPMWDPHLEKDIKALS